MKKGMTEGVILTVIGAALLIVCVAIFVLGMQFKGTSTPLESEDTTKTICPNNCVDNLDGTRCLQEYSGGSYRAFCGCRKNTQTVDCEGGECDVFTSKCVQ